MPIMLKDSYTSTGHKFFAHQEAMANLRNGKGQPIVTHIMPTDICQHTCAFCSVATREGSVLPFYAIESYIQTLILYGLKAVILSGGGNPILYRCPETKKGINELVGMLSGYGLEIGMITNGMPLRDYGGRQSWRTVTPETLDRLTWVRISMAGLDHPENYVYVPDIDPSKTALGFSYVLHDIYQEPENPNHGKVSTVQDLITFDHLLARKRPAVHRLGELEEQFRFYVEEYRPRYLRLLPNCLEPDLIAARCAMLQEVADRIDPGVVFVQYKPPAPPRACYLGYVHPVLNSDGFVYPCDSCVLNDTAGHKFANPWRIAHWTDVQTLYEKPVRSLVDPQALCPGCVFTRSNEILADVVDGVADLTPPSDMPEHANFI